MGLTPIFGSAVTEFGGAMHADNGVPIIFLGPQDFGAGIDATTGEITSASNSTYYNLGSKVAQDLNVLTSKGSTSDINGLILQQLDIQTARPVTTFYDLQGGSVYYVAGKSTVTIGLNRVVGPNGLVASFYNTFGRVCNAKYNALGVNLSKPACEPTGLAATTTANNVGVFNCLLSQLSMSITAQNFMITEASQIQGSELCYVKT
jgi:hypothetical protein